VWQTPTSFTYSLNMVRKMACISGRPSPL
jgi:hypothetical protein